MLTLEQLNPFNKRQNFRQVQIESICRRQNKYESKIVLERVENIVGNGKKCLYKQFLLFSQCFLNFFQGR